MSQQSAFGAHLHFLRKRADIPLRDLERLSGVKFTYIGQLERGYKRRRGVTTPVVNPGWEIVKALADALTKAPPGIIPEERRLLFQLAGHDERDPSGLAKKISPELARELKQLRIEDLVRTLDRISRGTGVGIRLRQSDADDRAEDIEEDQHNQN